MGKEKRRDNNGKLVGKRRERETLTFIKYKKLGKEKRKYGNEKWMREISGRGCWDLLKINWWKKKRNIQYWKNEKIKTCKYFYNCCFLFVLKLPFNLLHNKLYLQKINNMWKN